MIMTLRFRFSLVLESEPKTRINAASGENALISLCSDVRFVVTKSITSLCGKYDEPADSAAHLRSFRSNVV